MKLCVEHGQGRQRQAGVCVWVCVWGGGGEKLQA